MVIEYFFDNLNELMAKEGIKSPNELARKSGIAQSTINSWTLRKTNIPSAEHIEKLAAFFKVEPHYFFMRPGTQGEVPKSQDWSNFAVFLDDLAEQYLDADTKESWKRGGSPNEFIRLLRMNFETSSVGFTPWYMDILSALSQYVNLDYLTKARNKQIQIRESQSQASDALSKKKTSAP